MEIKRPTIWTKVPTAYSGSPDPDDVEFDEYFFDLKREQQKEYIK